MSSELITALIGVGATIAGTVLGWFLNNLSSRGKLNIYVASWVDEFKKNDVGEINDATMKKEVEYYGYKASIEIYNSSSDTMIMRNFQIAFMSNKETLKSFTPKDDATRLVTGQYTPAHYDNLGVINIPPKSVIKLDIHNGVWEQKDGIDFLWKTDAIFISYKNAKDKVKTKKIKDVDFNIVCDNLKSGGKENG